MQSPIDDDKTYEVHNYVKNGKDGLVTILEFREVLEVGLDILAALKTQKRLYRARGEAVVTVPAFNGQPKRQTSQTVDFKIEAQSLTEAFAGFDAGLQEAQKELQEDVNQQVQAMMLAGAQRGIVRPN